MADLNRHNKQSDLLRMRLTTVKVIMPLFTLTRDSRERGGGRVRMQRLMAMVEAVVIPFLNMYT